MQTSLRVLFFSLHFLYIKSTYSSDDANFQRNYQQILKGEFAHPSFSFRRPGQAQGQGNNNGTPFGESRFLLNSMQQTIPGRLNSLEPKSGSRYTPPEISHSTAVTPFSDMATGNPSQTLSPYAYKSDSEGNRGKSNTSMNGSISNINGPAFNYQQNQANSSYYKRKYSIENNSRDVLSRLAAFSNRKDGRIVTTTTTQPPPENAIEAASRSIGQTVEFGSSLVDVVFQVPQFVKLIENVVDSFIPGGQKKDATDVLHALPEALVQIVDFFSKINITVDLGKKLEVSLSQTLLEALNSPLLRASPATTLLSSEPIHTGQVQLDDISEDSTANAVLGSLYKVLGKTPEASAPLPSPVVPAAANHTMPSEFTGILAPINSFLILSQSPLSVSTMVESVKEFVSMSSLFFETINAVVNIAESAMDEMQVDRLVSSYKELLYDGKLASLGIVADAVPPEHLGTPTVSCVSQGMTCCVPHEAAGNYKKNPLYLQGMHRIECRGTFVSRSNMVCSTAPYTKSRCGIIHGEAPGIDTYTAVMPLTGFASNAVCQCQVSKTVNQDGLHDMTGSASWDNAGSTSKSLLESADKGWNKLKTFTTTGNSMVRILGLIVDPTQVANFSSLDGHSKGNTNSGKQLGAWGRLKNAL